jgi:hypothetical protein
VLVAEEAQYLRHQQIRRCVEGLMTGTWKFAHGCRWECGGKLPRNLASPERAGHAEEQQHRPPDLAGTAGQVGGRTPRGAAPGGHLPAPMITAAQLPRSSCAGPGWIPLVHLVHADRPAMMPLPAASVRLGGLLPATQPDDSHVRRHPSPVGCQLRAVAGGCDISRGDALLVLPPAR